MIRISASTLPVEEHKLVEYVKEMQKLNVDFIHCDVLDGVFVEDKCLSIDTIKNIKANTLLPLDIHLMVNEPKKVIDEYLKLKPNYLTVHYEAFKYKTDLLETIQKIASKKVLVGLSIKPATLVKEIESILPLVDLVLIMGVEPGKSGQKMLSNTARKIKQLRGIIYEKNLNIKIEADGGINEENINSLSLSGVDIVVMGKSLYECKNKEKLINKIHTL